MNSEYVQFKKNEKKSIIKSFLTSELLLLDSLKKYKIYKNLRTEELLLKISLKTKIDHLNINIAQFERMLPKTTIPVKGMSTFEEDRKNYTLEEEIDLIKKKLATLNSQF